MHQELALVQSSEPKVFRVASVYWGTAKGLINPLPCNADRKISTVKKYLDCSLDVVSPGVTAACFAQRM